MAEHGISLGEAIPPPVPKVIEISESHCVDTVRMRGFKRRKRLFRTAQLAQIVCQLQHGLHRTRMRGSDITHLCQSRFHDSAGIETGLDQCAQSPINACIDQMLWLHDPLQKRSRVRFNRESHSIFSVLSAARFARAMVSSVSATAS